MGKKKVEITRADGVKQSYHVGTATAPPTAQDNAVVPGKWMSKRGKCNRCGSGTYGSIPTPASCPKCGNGSGLSYDEFMEQKKMETYGKLGESVTEAVQVFSKLVGEKGGQGFQPTDRNRVPSSPSLSADQINSEFERIERERLAEERRPAVEAQLAVEREQAQAARLADWRRNVAAQVERYDKYYPDTPVPAWTKEQAEDELRKVGAPMVARYRYESDEERNKVCAALIAGRTLMRNPNQAPPTFATS